MSDRQGVGDEALREALSGQKNSLAHEMARRGQELQMTLQRIGRPRDKPEDNPW